MPVRAPEPLRAARRRLRARRGYAAFVAAVEPGLLAHTRVHRFAAPPVTGDPAPEPVAVWVAPGEDTADTRASLARQTVAPAAVLGEDAAAALAATRAPWVLLLRAGDTLAPVALERLGQAAALAPDAALLTCDEDLAGRRAPRLRPGPAPDQALAGGLAGAPLCVRPAAALAAGPEPEEVMALRLAGPDGAGHAHVPLVLVHRAAFATPRADVRAVLPAGARVEPAAGHWRRIRRPLAAEPRVEVVVPTRDHAALLERCARTVLGATAWERLGLCVVDNGSTDPAVAALLAGLARDERVRVVHDPRPFNFPALVNAAAATSEADVIVLLNDDTEVLDAGWVETLAEEAVRPEVGAVAPLLLYPDGRVQHAGAAIGLWGTAGHPFAGLDPWRSTPFGAAEDATRNWLAVSAACLAVERHKLLAAGGLDETFAVAGNDVDLGLRLTAAGHRSLCVPHARLLHHEGASRGQSFAPGDLARSRERYAPWLAAGDPFYHPALTLRATSCALRGPDEAGP